MNTFAYEGHGGKHSSEITVVVVAVFVVGGKCGENRLWIKANGWKKIMFCMKMAFLFIRFFRHESFYPAKPINARQCVVSSFEFTLNTLWIQYECFSNRTLWQLFRLAIYKCFLRKLEEFLILIWSKRAPGRLWRHNCDTVSKHPLTHTHTRTHTIIIAIGYGNLYGASQQQNARRTGWATASKKDTHTHTRTHAHIATGTLGKLSVVGTVEN